MSRYNIGIDTGGTYTDAVVIDMSAREVIAASKAITTHGDLSIGVSAALDAVLAQVAKDFPRDEIGLVSVSTTLATNALVEGHGAAVAVVLIGFDDAMVGRSRIASTIADTHIIRVAGGHTHNGEEVCPLDEQALRAAVRNAASNVAAFAVAAHYSVRNSSHELRAEKVIREITSTSVTRSSDLSDALDAPRRALTATLNARIVSKIVALLEAVRTSLSNYDIAAKLMIVKGDGSLVSADAVVERPIETILSGPAASVIGARYLSGESDFIVSDIGGTTTDIAIAHNGWPKITDAGSTIGGYQTLVQAVDMHTSGLGGDSEVITDYRGNVRLASHRVIPVCSLGSRWPHISLHLEEVLHNAQGLRTACKFLLRPIGPRSDRIPVDLGDHERKIFGQITETPQPWATLIHRTSDERAVQHLLSRGLVQVTGLTPSDAAHALGKQSQWCEKTAQLACQLVGQSSGIVSANSKMNTEELMQFADRIIEEVTRKSCHLLLSRLCGHELSADHPLVAATISGNSKVGEFMLNGTTNIPIVAVGGPAAVYYPEVGRRLGSQTVIPPHSAVANAVGAATGMIKTLVTIEIAAVDDGGYVIHLPGEPRRAPTVDLAIRVAREFAEDLAQERAIDMGAMNVRSTFKLQRVDLPNVDEAHSLIAATLTVECIGEVV